MVKPIEVSDELKLKVEYRILDCMRVLDKLLSHTEIEFPYITYDVRGRVAGTACSETHTIDLNPVLLNENGDKFINRTVVHEFAHLVDAILHPWTRETKRGRGKRSLHGRTWKWVMVQFGAETSRTHSYDTSNSAVKTKSKYRYVCLGCKKDMFFGPTKHKRQQSGEESYGHRGCNFAKIEYLEPLGKVTWQEARAGKKKSCGGYYAPVPLKKKPRVTKFDRAMKIIAIYNSLHIVESKRNDIIDCFMSELEMSKSGATTYYYKCKKEITN